MILAAAPIETGILMFVQMPWLIRALIAASDGIPRVLSTFRCYGLYDGRSLGRFRETHGDVGVVLVSPAMADREGALLHPGIHILQTILRDRGITCEVLNYNLPTVNPRDPFDHLIKLVQTLHVRVVGVSLYSQAIQSTMHGLQRLKAACPETKIVLGGPHPTEAYLSLLGLRFIDYVLRGEAEASFPALVEKLLRQQPVDPNDIAGVFAYDRGRREVMGKQGDFVDLDALDARTLLRYHLREDERRQYQHYRGAHGLVGSRYWPISLVRGCPYACTFCAAYQMSGKRLRYRDARKVVDELEFYVRTYGQRHFSFVDDAFTEDYDYVIAFCNELLRRQLRVHWTTDNGIRTETLGAGRRLQRYLESKGIDDFDHLARLMMRSGWSGTSVGIESGSDRVRENLVRKGGTRLTNQEILHCLKHLKDLAQEEKIPFYINAYFMIGYPDFLLRNGKTVTGELDAEREETHRFILELRDSGAANFVHVSVLIPLPGTEMWDHLDIAQRMRILLAHVDEDHEHFRVLREIEAEIATRAAHEWRTTSYNEEAERAFWQRIYDLPDQVQMDLHAAYDCFNADLSFSIRMNRPDSEALFALRQRILTDFYGGIRQELRLMRHVVRQSMTLRDGLTYLSFFGKTYLPDTKRLRFMPQRRPQAPHMHPRDSGLASRAPR
jgi:radical SAM superfamily enzyme YgiQ (UPF0313 family)